MDQQAIKWIVIGVVALVAMLLFRKPLGRLIDRTTDVDVSPKGVSLKTPTPLGNAEYSGVTLGSGQAPSPGTPGLFSSTSDHFQIQWPLSGWTASEAMGVGLQQQLGLPPTVRFPLVILRDDPVAGFRPNVNVVVEPVGALPVEDYVAKTLQLFQEEGWSVFSTQVDPATHGALLVFSQASLGANVFQIQRIVMAYGKALVVTASQLPPDDQLSLQLRNDLLGILNSFRILPV